MNTDVRRTITDVDVANAQRVSGAWNCRTLSITVVSLALGAVATGCTPSDHEIRHFIQSWEASVSGTDYRVQPPDVIAVSSAQAPEIDGTAHKIRSDGKVTFRLLGEVTVAGMTPTEIGEKITGLLETYYVDPEVSVRVDGNNSKRYYVFGQVSRVGAFPYTGRDTLLHALAAAQPNLLAAQEIIQVIRPSHIEGERHVLTIDAYRMTREGRLDQNILLQEGDIIYVPPTVLAWIGLQVQQLLYPVAPVSQMVTTPVQTSNSLDTLSD